MVEPELDPFSPAGTVERFGDFSRGLGRRRWGKFAIWMMLVVIFLIPSVLLLVTYLVQHH
jgi:cell division protein FtsX